MRILLLCITLLIASPLWAATYYIDPDCVGQGGDGTTTTCGASGPFETWDESEVNYACGNTYLIKKDTTYRVPSANTLIINESCDSGTVMTISTYGTGAAPIITDTVIIGDVWTEDSANIWYDDGNTAQAASQRRRANINGVPVGLNTSTSVDAAQPWYYDGAKYWVYNVGDPNGLVEIWSIVSSTFLVTITGDYIDINGLHFRGGKDWLIYGNGATHINFYNNTVNGKLAILGGSNYWDIYNNTFDMDYNVLDSAQDTSPDWFMDTLECRGAQYNKIHHNIFYDGAHSVFLWNGDSSSVAGGCSNNYIYENYLYRTPEPNGENVYGRCFEIQGSDGANTRAQNNLFARNYCDNYQTLSQLSGNNNTFLSNVWSNMSPFDAAGSDSSKGVTLTSPSSGIVTDMNFYNNIFYNIASAGIEVDEENGVWPDDIEIKNNVFIETGVDPEIAAFIDIAISVDADGAGAVDYILMENNIIYNTPETGVIYYKGSEYTVASCGAAMQNNDTCSNNLNTDPLFTDESTGVFTLTAQSPAIDSCSNIAATINGTCTDVDVPWDCCTGVDTGTCHYGFAANTDFSSAANFISTVGAWNPEWDGLWDCSAIQFPKAGGE